MKNLEIKIINPTQLEETITKSGLQLSESDAIRGAYLPYLEQFADIVKQAIKINTENPTDIDEKISRELRLKTVKVRKAAEGTKEERKKIYLLKGNLEQSSYNIIRDTCMLAEAAFEQVEKAREIAENKRQSELKAVRVAELSDYTNAEIYPLGNMTAEAYFDLLSGFKLKREADIKAEADRAEALLLEEQRKAAEAEEMRKENERLKKEAEAKEKELAAERAKIDKERKEAESKLAEERRIEAEKAAKLKAEQDAILKAERENARFLAEELQVKKDAEQAELARKAKEAAEQIAAEKKLAKASESEQLTAWLNQVKFAPMPVMKTDDAQNVALAITAKFEGFKKWANEQINSL